MPDDVKISSPDFSQCLTCIGLNPDFELIPPALSELGKISTRHFEIGALAQSSRMEVLVVVFSLIGSLKLHALLIFILHKYQVAMSLAIAAKSNQVLLKISKLFLKV